MQVQQTAKTAATLAIPPTMAAPITRRFITINECANLRPFSPASMRDLKFKAHDRKNSRGDIIKGNGTGAAGVWVQIGRKVVIDLEAFDKWIDSHKRGAA